MNTLNSQYLTRIPSNFRSKISNDIDALIFNIGKRHYCANYAGDRFYSSFDSSEHQKIAFPLKSVSKRPLNDHNTHYLLKMETNLVKNLIKNGDIPKALKLWQSINPQTTRDQKYWTNICISILCENHRVAQAEKLVSQYPESVHVGTCLAFVHAYANLHQSEKIDKWIKRLFILNKHADNSNTALSFAVNAKLWPQVQRIIKLMSSAGHKVNTDILATCVYSIHQDVPLKTLATMLREDGNLVNSTKFRRLLNSGTRMQLRQFLQDDKLTEAFNIFENYTGIHEVSLAYLLLRYLIRNSSNIHNIDMGLLEKLKERVMQSPTRDNLFVEFMLTYHGSIGDITEVWKIAEEYKLFSARPSISGKLSLSAYSLLWKLIFQNIQKEGPSLPVSLRLFALNSSYNTALRGKLLDHIILTFNTIPDVPAITTILEFACESCSIPLDGKLIERITGSPQPQDSKDWKSIATLLCEVHNIEFETAMQLSKEYRQQFHLIT